MDCTQYLPLMARIREDGHAVIRQISYSAERNILIAVIDGREHRIESVTGYEAILRAHRAAWEGRV